MLKLNSNIIPDGEINGINTIYELPAYIAYIKSIVVDGELVTDFSFEDDQLELEVAPVTSISVTFFSREERDIEGNGEVTLADLVEDVYDEIGRKQYNRIFDRKRIVKELNKTVGVLRNNIKTKIQQYSFKGLNGLTVLKGLNTVDISVKDSYPLDIEGVFITQNNILYNYYSYDGLKFEVSGEDLIDDFDKLLVGHRIPSGVEKVSEVYVNGHKLEYIDYRDFYFRSIGVFTIITDYNGNQYILLPFSDREYVAVVKYAPDYAIVSKDEDILDIPYSFTRAYVYDVAFRLLASREDDRAAYYAEQRKEEERKYKAYRQKTTNKVKSKIGIGDTYGSVPFSQLTTIPEGIYDQYR